MHMWRLVLASEPDDKVGQDYDSSGSVPPDAEHPQEVPHHHHHHQMSEVHVSTEKVCTSLLPLPSGVQVIHAVPAVGHLSSSSIYPACLAPYVIVTACSDYTVRFWRAKLVESTEEIFAFLWILKCRGAKTTFQFRRPYGNYSVFVNNGPVSLSIGDTPHIFSAQHFCHLPCIHLIGNLKEHLVRNTQKFVPFPLCEVGILDLLQHMVDSGV